MSLLLAFPEEIEADLAYRGLDVGDWWRGDMSSRRLVILVKHLPDDSATKRAMAEDPWPLMTHLLVSVVNEQRLARADYATVHGERVKPPLIPRPNDQLVEDERATAHNLHDALMSMAAPPTSPDDEDARARLRREQPAQPQVEVT